MKKRTPFLKISNVNNTHIAIVRALWHPKLTKELLKHALDVLHRYQCHTQVFEVSGTYEIPFFVQMLLEISKQINQGNPHFQENNPIYAFLKHLNGVVALGCVIKGETDHNFYINQAVANQLQNLMFHYKIPIAFGIITAFNVEQAQQRTKKGKEAAEALLHTLSSLYPLLPTQFSNNFPYLLSLFNFPSRF